MKPILLIGSEGSMGLRYQAIFNHLKTPFIACDKQHSIYDVLKYAKNCDKILLCTPTDTHFKFLLHLIPMNKDILCEKPISKSVNEVRDLIELLKIHSSKLTMVMQYEELLTNEPDNGSFSYYNYFRTGKDGLAWDCLQIIAFSKKEPALGNNSPTWECTINGQNLNIKDMDQAYVSFIRNWLNDKKNQNLSFLLGIHEKVERYARKQIN